MTAPVRVVFVCLGNICRSPTAEGVMRDLVAVAGASDRIEVDSAGTAAYHVGKPPDERTIAEAAGRGVDLSGLRARRVDVGDLIWFDRVIAMDHANAADLHDLAPDATTAAKVTLLRSHDPLAVATGELDVPDPYHGGPEGFATVYDLIERGCRGLLDDLTRAGEHPR